MDAVRSCGSGLENWWNWRFFKVYDLMDVLRDIIEMTPNTVNL
jgi:hypothetical protein